MNNQMVATPDVTPETANCPTDNVVASGDKMALAMFYVPVQEWTDVYELDIALCRGTIFPCLDKPFLGEKVSSSR